MRFWGGREFDLYVVDAREIDLQGDPLGVDAAWMTGDPIPRGKLRRVEPEEYGPVRTEGVPSEVPIRTEGIEPAPARVLTEDEIEGWLAYGEAEYRGVLYHGTRFPDEVREMGLLYGPPDDPTYAFQKVVWLTDSKQMAEGYGELTRVAVKFKKPLRFEQGETLEDAYRRMGVDASKYDRPPGKLPLPSMVAEREGYDAVITWSSEGNMLATAYDLDGLRVVLPSDVRSEGIVRDPERGVQLALVRPEAVAEARRLRQEPGQGTRRTRTTTPVEGQTGHRDALLIQAERTMLAPPEMRATVERMVTLPTGGRDDGMLLDLYNSWTRKRLQALAGSSKVAVRVRAHSLPTLFEEGRLRNAHHGHVEVEPDRGETYVSRRGEFERAIWSIDADPTADPDAFPVYGYLTTDDEDLESNAARAFGNVKLTLKPERASAHDLHLLRLVLRQRRRGERAGAGRSAQRACRPLLGQHPWRRVPRHRQGLPRPAPAARGGTGRVRRLDRGDEPDADRRAAGGLRAKRQA